jgi:hypothetical protein
MPRGEQGRIPVVIYVLVSVVGVLALGAALIVFSRPPRRDDIERFHRARAMTTEWSRSYAATGHLSLPREPAHDRAPHREPAGNGAENGKSRREPQPAERR